jgi:hypothetical protein
MHKSAGEPRFADVPDGCDLFASCLACLLPACKYEMRPNQGRALVRAARLVELLRSGRTMDEAATDLGVSRRTAYRLREVR